jgi:tetratricopeptide (TPR) repeat protein
VADSSERPEIRAQSIWLRQNLAMALNQGGQTEAADQVFDQLLADPEEGTRHQVLIAYANHLTATQRAAQAETMLKDELANRTDLQGWEESNLYYTLANAARMSGGEARGQEYQRKAEEKTRTGQLEQPAQVLVRDDLQQAETAARSGNFEQAVQFVRTAIDKAPQALDREQLAWGVSMTADLIVAKNPVAADGLYRSVITTVESWSEDTVLPLLNLYPSYARFLMQQQRWGDAANVIDAYRSALTTARGEDTGWLEDVLQLRIEAARRSNTPESGVEAANEFLALEERVTGTTSEPYLRALETLAEMLDSTGDFGWSLPLRRQAVTTVDLVSTPAEVRRGYTRMNAAFALARVQQFEEAEQLGSQAVAISESLHPPQPELFAAQLQQIRQMKSAPPTPSTTCQ